MPRPPITDDGRDSLIEVFHDIEARHSYLPPDELQAAARNLGYSDTQAYGVASFYRHFSTQPRGKNVIRVCTSVPCMLEGSDELLSALEKKLGIRVGETTDDGRFTLETTECVGQCNHAPVVTIDHRPCTQIPVDQAEEFLAQCRRASQEGEL